MFAKKNVVAAAALALLAVGAQAQVTLYGTIDASIARKQTANLAAGTKSTTTNVDSGDMSASFVGIKGQEDLGNGLKGTFRLEAAFNLDTGTQAAGSFFGQNATVGLAGGFGAVNLGRFENVFKTEGGAFNPFGTSGFYSTTFATGLADGSSWSNGVEYVSPNLGGLTFTAQHSAKEDSRGAGGRSGGATAAAVNYTAAGLGLSAVYGDVRSTESTPGALPRSRAWLLGASYDFQVAKLYAQYGQDKVDGAPEEKYKGFQVGVAVPVTEAGAFLVSYGETKLTDSDERTRAASLGYTHNISKRTNAYVAYKNQRERDAANSVTTNSFGVGVRHSF